MVLGGSTITLSRPALVLLVRAKALVSRYRSDVQALPERIEAATTGNLLG